MGTSASRSVDPDELKSRPALAVPDALNASIVVGQLLAVASCLAATRFATLWWQIALLAMVFGLVMNSIYSTIHEAYHRMLFSNRRCNEAAGILLALLFPASFHLLRQGHLGHHARNRSDDEAFDLYFEGDSVVWKVFAWYGILTGLYWLLVAISNLVLLVAPSLLDSSRYKWDRNCEAFLESFDPSLRPVMRLEALAAIALHVCIVWGFELPWQTYLVLYATFGWMWSSMQYVHHYNTERDVRNGARNLFLCEPIDSLWLNHNWHLTHHRHPTVPWVYLRKIAHAEGQRRGFLPFSYIGMWRGPRRGTERMHNEYAGRIIR